MQNDVVETAADDDMVKGTLQIWAGAAMALGASSFLVEPTETAQQEEQKTRFVTISTI